ncbi:hypothetical protein TNCV_858981, partial [Trichonephila clavipes]
FLSQSERFSVLRDRSPLSDTHSFIIRPNLLPDFSVLTHFTTATCSSITEIINSPFFRKVRFWVPSRILQRYSTWRQSSWIP